MTEDDAEQTLRRSSVGTLREVFAYEDEKRALPLENPA